MTAQRATLIGHGAPDAPPDPVAQPAPLLPIALGLIAGICLDRFLPCGPIAYAVLFIAAMAAAVAGLGLRRRRLRIAATVAVIAVAGAICHHAHYRHVPPDSIAALAGDTPRLCRLTGIISRRPHVSSAGPRTRGRLPSWRWHLEVEHAEIGGFRGQVSGKVSLVVRGEFDRPPALGERIEVLGALVRTQPPHNPGQWDYCDYMRREGIAAVCFTKTPAAIRLTAEQPHPTANLFNLRAIRRGVGDLARAPLAQMTRYTDGDEGKRLLSALLVGDRSEMDPDVKDAFIRTGTLHFLAISGLHVGMLAVFVWFVCRLCRMSIRPAAMVVIVMVILYALAADFRPSIMRATIVVIAIAMGTASGRRTGRANSLALAAIIMLALRPADLFNTGFQLCFLVAGAVMLVPSRLYQAWFAKHFEIERLRIHAPEYGWLAFIRGPALRWLAHAACVAVVAWLAGAPLAAKSFGVIAPIAPLASILLFPLVCIALVVGFAYLAVAMWLPIAAAPLAVAADGVARVLNGSVEAIALIPGGQIWTDGPSWPALGLLYSLATLWLVSGRPAVRRLFRGRLRAWHPLAGILLVLIVEVSVGFLPRRGAELAVTVLDVGHGTAVVIECPGGQTLVYDAGSSRYSRVGASVIEPCLRGRGIGRIDVLILSHPDLDHYSGAGDLLDRFPVGCVVTTPHFRRLAAGGRAAALLEKIERMGVPLLIASAGDGIDGLGEVEVRILGPPAESLPLGGYRSEKNDSSLVLSVQFAGRRMLLPGDIEEIGLEHLLARRPRRHNALLTAHHGERGELAAALIERLAPAVAVTSGGTSRELPTTTQRDDVKHFQTSRDGAVRLTFSKQHVHVETFAAGRWWAVEEVNSL